MLKLLALKDAYLKNEEGATAIEYGLIAAGISLAIVAVVFTFGDQLETTFTSMETAMDGANSEIETSR
jgi:pilus assembly protein Flp/PilA